MIKFAVIAFSGLSLSSVAVAQETRIEVPPPAPPLKSGTIVCSMYDEAGAKFKLVLKAGNWEEKSRGGLVKFALTAPEHLALPKEVPGNLEPGRSGFFDYDSDARVSIDGRLNASYSPRGTLTIERHRIGAQYPNNREYFVGICDVDLSTEYGRLPE